MQNIPKIYVKYRFMHLVDKQKNKPVFDKECIEYRKHRELETKRENAQLLFNNGYGGKRIRGGNLGIEAVNAQINSFNFTKSKQGLLRAYSRSTLIFLSVNIKKFKYWSTYLQKNYPEIYQQLYQIREDLFNLTILNEKENENLIQSIAIDDNELNDSIKKLVKKHNLKFKYQWDYYGECENLELINWLADKPSDFELTETTLKQLTDHFENRFSAKFLRQKCYDYGINFIMTPN